MKNALIYIALAILINCPNPLFGSGRLTKEDVSEKTRIKWNIINIDNEQAVISELSRRHPLMPKIEFTDESKTQYMHPQLQTAGLKTIGKKQAQNFALNFLIQNAPILGFSVPQTLRDNCNVNAADPNIPELGQPDDTNQVLDLPNNTEGYEVIETIEHKYRGRDTYLGRDFIVVIAQKHKGIRVFEAQCRVVMDQFGEIYTVKNSSQADIIAPSAPIITRENAVAIAITSLQSPDTAMPAPELVIYGPEHLAWHMNFYDPVFKEVLVDAVTGQLLLSRSNILSSSDVTLTVLDADNLGLRYVEGSYLVPSFGFDIIDWTHKTDIFGKCSDAFSTAGPASSAERS